MLMPKMLVTMLVQNVKSQMCKKSDLISLRFILDKSILGSALLLRSMIRWGPTSQEMYEEIRRDSN